MTTVHPCALYTALFFCEIVCVYTRVLTLHRLASGMLADSKKWRTPRDEVKNVFKSLRERAQGEGRERGGVAIANMHSRPHHRLVTWTQLGQASLKEDGRRRESGGQQSL